MKFVTYNDLPATDKAEIDRIQAMSSHLRNATETAYLTNRAPYLTNEIIETDSDGLILLARGNTVPTGYEGFAKGAIFIEQDATTKSRYENVGSSTSATWDLMSKTSTGDLDETLDFTGKTVVVQLLEETPVNAVSATGQLTFSDAVTDGETVTIGDDVYEFDTDSTVTSGNIAVDVSGGATAGDAATALTAAITASGTEPVSAVAGVNNVDITADTAGAAANSIATTTTCADGAWGGETLTGGVNGTVGAKGQLYFDSTALYLATNTNTVSGANWKKVDLASLS